MDPQNAPGAPKMLILEFELEQKMNHNFRIEFHEESNGNSLKAQKLNHDTLIALIGPNYPINGLFFNFEIEQKIYHHSRAEFQDKSNGNDFIFIKP